MTTARRLSFTSRDFATIRAELEAIAREVGPEFWTDFFQSNLGSALMDLLALVGDNISYGQDVVLQEMFLSTCRRFESALRFAKSVGYRPRAAQAASVPLVSGDLPAALVANGGTIPAGTVITGSNGLPYELLDAVTVPAGAGVVKITLKQGVSYSEQFTPSAKPYQTYTTLNPIVEEGSWRLYIGPVNTSNLWTEVDNVDLETTASNTYSTEIDAVGRLVLRFGNGTRGRIPDQAGTISYRKTAGAGGNAASNTIKGTAVVNVTGGGTVSLPFSNADQPDNTQVEYTVPSESQGLTVADATQSGTLIYSPAVAGTVEITFNLPTPGDKIVVRDNGAGGFTITTKTGTVAGISISSSSVAYTSVQWTVTFSSALLAGGTVTAVYNALQTADVGALISGSAAGGTDREGVEEMRRNVPAYIAAQRRVVTLRDYKASVEALEGVARAYVDTVAASYTGNFVRTSVWQTETVDFTVDSGEYRSTVPYTRYRTGSVALAQSVSNALRERTMVTVSNIVALPSMLWVDVYLKQVFYDTLMQPADVHKALVQAVVNVFQDGDGFNLRMADIINAVRGVDGIRYFTLDRVAVGTQAYSTEEQSPTISAPTATGRLGRNMQQTDSVIVPQSVVIVIDQPSGSITVQDDGAGGFEVVAGVRSISTSAIDYNTGYWSITFTGGNLSPSRPVTASYADVTLDYRNTQLSKIDDTLVSDQYPPPGITLTNDPQAPPYFDGKPKTVLRGTVDVTGTVPYLAGDETRYESLRDISSQRLAGAVHFYNEQFYYNNEILYDSITGVSPAVRALCLRKLNFTLTPAN